MSLEDRVMLLAAARIGYQLGAARNMRPEGGRVLISRWGLAGVDAAAIYGAGTVFSRMSDAARVALACGFAERFMHRYSCLADHGRTAIDGVGFAEFVDRVVDLAGAKMAGIKRQMDLLGVAGADGVEVDAAGILFVRAVCVVMEAAVRGAVCGAALAAQWGRADGSGSVFDGPAGASDKTRLDLAARCMMEIGYLRGSHLACGLRNCPDVGAGPHKDENFLYLFGGVEKELAIDAVGAFVDEVLAAGVGDCGDLLVDMLRAGINSPFLVSDVLPEIVHDGVVSIDGVGMYFHACEKELNRSVEGAMAALQMATSGSRG